MKPEVCPGCGRRFTHLAAHLKMSTKCRGGNMEAEPMSLPNPPPSPGGFGLSPEVLGQLAQMVAPYLQPMVMEAAREGAAQGAKKVVDDVLANLPNYAARAGQNGSGQDRASVPGDAPAAAAPVAASPGGMDLKQILGVAVAQMMMPKQQSSLADLVTMLATVREINQMSIGPYYDGIRAAGQMMIPALRAGIKPEDVGKSILAIADEGTKKSATSQFS